MTQTKAQKAALAHLRAAYAGPESGQNEVLLNRPNLQYSVGMLFPAESVEQEISEDVGTTSVKTGDVEEQAAAVPLAEDWRPSSVAISFVTDSPIVQVDFSGGTYQPINDDGPPRWQREGFEFRALELSRTSPTREVQAGNVKVDVGSRWRDLGSRYLVTVHVRISEPSTMDEKLDIARMIFQVELAICPSVGSQILEYDGPTPLDLDDESAELRLRFRNRKVFAVGHGMAANWDLLDGQCSRIYVDAVPAHIVPNIETTGFDPASPEAGALSLAFLAQLDSCPADICFGLDSFIASFESWVRDQESRTHETSLSGDAARRIVHRSRVAAGRMNAAVEVLRAPENSMIRSAFSLGMSAMRLQMKQAASARGDTTTEPTWRPFQLGFLLVSLDSTMNEQHPDRELVDLIWFPTGGGKTEAYLALAAIEIFRRRLAYGTSGGGTAVLTRYTLRLLTAQQFERAAALICAMELIRTSDSRAKRMARFTIGLWVGNEVTPGTLDQAKSALERLHKAARPEESNSFQIESCPWCDASLIPSEKSLNGEEYGIRFSGKDLIIHCTNAECPFSDQLPIAVDDETIYRDPPTIVLATVDKFARLQFKIEAGRILGLDTVFHQPSLIIQDELHLLSGPLGTTVSVFDAIIQILLARTGTPPKIVASTATIRASEEQISGLYGRSVALYPPSGLDDDRSFFSRPVEDGTGRLYVGLMPQSTSQASALISAASPLIELPDISAKASETTSFSKDDYWTLVMYHNSLRELGRSGTLVLDDVNGRLETRADRLDRPLRPIRAGRVLELTSRRGPEELPKDLRQLRLNANNSSEAIDVVLSSNMLSVGIDIPRLALMLMVGQPKTTAEYIQATSRVGRGETKGIVVTLFRSNRARDRSHFETFRGYHEALYRNVEPTSVTPWSLASRRRSLAGALVALVRHTVNGLASDDSAANLDLSNSRMRNFIEQLVERVVEIAKRSEPYEAQEVEEDFWALLGEWDNRAQVARDSGNKLRYERHGDEKEALLKRFGQQGEGWVVGDSMRSVEPSVAVEVQEPNERTRNAAH